MGVGGGCCCHLITGGNMSVDGRALQSDCGGQYGFW